MGVLNLDYEMVLVQGRHKHLAVSREEFQKFNAGVLGLGDVSRPDESVDALVGVFDLEGFTSFCDQVDPQLVVPDFLDRMLYWMFHKISLCFAREAKGSNIILWGKFPFYAKFTGDGIIFLWDTHGLGQASMGNIIINLYKVTRAYIEEFLPEAGQAFNKVPSKLRCGVARGQVIPIGGGRDFVGSCINEAARLQKTSQLSFVFARKGFKPEEAFGEVWREKFTGKRIKVRGLQDDELVLVCTDEFEALPESEKKLFSEH